MKTKTIEKVSFIDLRTEDNFQENVLKRWSSSLANSSFIDGPACKELNERICEFTQAKFFVGCANGTDAIQIALRAVGVGPGDKVILPDFTFWATYEAVINVGATPILIDISEDDMQADFNIFCEAAAKHSPKAAILVHLYGWCSSRIMDFRDFCKRKNIFLIEDGAQSLGTTFEGESLNKRAFLATTSFYPAKVLGAAGDAGGIFTNDEKIAKICSQLANHGRSSHYGYEFIGWNSRLDEVQAHYVCESLLNLPARISSRLDGEKMYKNFFETQTNLPVEMKNAPKGVGNNGYLQVSLAKTSAKEIIESLKQFSIGAGNVYPTPISAQIPASKCELFAPDKIAYHIAPKVVNLPLFPYIQKEEIDYVCECLKKL
jgi:dTDP-4-amino-4,6-dideoxygalactose transaminase